MSNTTTFPPNADDFPQYRIDPAIQHLRHALHVSETLATARLKEREDYQRIAYEHGEEIKRLEADMENTDLYLRRMETVAKNLAVLVVRAKDCGTHIEGWRSNATEALDYFYNNVGIFKSPTDTPATKPDTAADYWQSACGADAKYFLEQIKKKDEEIKWITDRWHECGESGVVYFLKQLKKKDEELDTYRRFEEWVQQWCNDRLPNADHTKDVSLREQLNAVWDKATGYGTDRGADERAASGKVVEALQNEVGRLTRELEAAEKACAEMRAGCEAALELLCDAGHAKHYDPSWIRPKQLSTEDVKASCIQAYHRLHVTLETAKQLGLGGDK